MKLVRAFLLCVAAILANPGTAHASDDGLAGTNDGTEVAEEAADEDSGTNGSGPADASVGATVTFDEKTETSGSNGQETGSNTDSDGSTRTSNGGNDANGDTANSQQSSSAPVAPKTGPQRAHVDAGRAEPPCAGNWVTPPEIGAPRYCTNPMTCAAERIDDHYSGRISANTETRGAYAEYLASIASQAISSALTADFDTFNQIRNNSPLLGSLGPAPTNTAIAVFNYCRAGPTFELIDPNWAPSFTWTTSVEAEYDVPAVFANLRTELRAQLDFYNPEVATAPPIEIGHTYVKFPTWLWIQGGTTNITATTTNAQVDNISFSLRATLDHVTFTLDSATITCTPEQLIAFDPDQHHPIDDAGHCNHTFTQRGNATIGATITYRVDERIQQRAHRSNPWPDTPWQTHTPQPTIELTPDAAPLEIREILSLNVNQELAG